MLLYLASKSPRRKELLKQMGITAQVLLVDTPEAHLPTETAEQYSLRVTEEKLIAAQAKMVADKLPVLPILCADTEVVLDGKILGKPASREAAFQMLKAYSGRTHEVITSVGLRFKEYQKLLVQKTTLTFTDIPETAINHYLATGDYKDKAGGYGIQGYMGQFICHIEGCFYSVMGLPLHTVRTLLIDLKKHHPVDF